MTSSTWVLVIILFSHLVPGQEQKLSSPGLSFDYSSHLAVVPGYATLEECQRAAAYSDHELSTVAKFPTAVHCIPGPEKVRN